MLHFSVNGEKKIPKMYNENSLNEFHVLANLFFVILCFFFGDVDNFFLGAKQKSNEYDNFSGECVANFIMWRLNKQLHGFNLNFSFFWTNNKIAYEIHSCCIADFADTCSAIYFGVNTWNETYVFTKIGIVWIRSNHSQYY